MSKLDFFIGDDVDLDETDPTLVDVLDRLLDRGVVVAGDLQISVAGVGLLFVGVRVLLASVDTIEEARERRRNEVAAQLRAERRVAV